MGARVPLDVDLEDKLFYGLSPVHLGYLVLFGLAAMTCWNQHWAPGPLRLAGSLVLLAGGVAMAWGRWQGRGVDEWLLDATLYVAATYQLEVETGGRRCRVVQMRLPWAGVAGLLGSASGSPE